MSNVHPPYLREAEVKDISIQLLHCPCEPVSAEILSTEFTVKTPHTQKDTESKMLWKYT